MVLDIGVTSILTNVGVFILGLIPNRVVKSKSVINSLIFYHISLVFV